MLDFWKQAPYLAARLNTMKTGVLAWTKPELKAAYSQLPFQFSLVFFLSRWWCKAFRLLNAVWNESGIKKIRTEVIKPSSNPSMSNITWVYFPNPSLRSLRPSVRVAILERKKVTQPIQGVWAKSLLVKRDLDSTTVSFITTKYGAPSRKKI